MGDRNDWLIGLGTAVLIVFVAVLLVTWSWPFSAVTLEGRIEAGYAPGGCERTLDKRDGPRVRQRAAERAALCDRID